MGEASLNPYLPSNPVQVQVLTGKDAGKQAMVTQVVRARNWVVVEGLNTVSIERGGDPRCIPMGAEQP